MQIPPDVEERLRLLAEYLSEGVEPRTYYFTPSAVPEMFQSTLNELSPTGGDQYVVSFWTEPQQDRGKVVFSSDAAEYLQAYRSQ